MPSGSRDALFLVHVPKYLDLTPEIKTMSNVVYDPSTIYTTNENHERCSLWPKHETPNFWRIMDKNNKLTSNTINLFFKEHTKYFQVSFSGNQETAPRVTHGWGEEGGRDIGGLLTALTHNKSCYSAHLLMAGTHRFHGPMEPLFSTSKLLWWYQGWVICGLYGKEQIRIRKVSDPFEVSVSWR